MSDTLPTCVNHREVQTRVSCSSCGDPICTRCMRHSAVGQKCPSCARLPRQARALGKPIHYVRAVGAGLGVAVVGGLALVQLLAVVRFGTLILAALLGFGVGRVVGWGASGQTQQPFPGLAVGCAALGLATGFTLAYGTPAPASAWLLLAYLAAGYFAVRGVHSG